MIDRRGLIKGLAAMGLFAPAMLRAQDMSRIALAPIHVRDSRLWMPVRFGGGQPHPFVIDTGAFANLIGEELARRLDLRDVGSLRVAGFGGTERFAAYRAPDVSLGEVRVGAMTFAAYRQPELFHPAAAGALSAAVLTVADSDLDFDAGQWRLHLDGRSDRSGFEALPSTIRAESLDAGAAKILVDTVIDGKTYRLEVDTGSPGAITLDAAAARRSGLWNDSTPFSPHRRRGIGGDGGRARLVRAGAVSLGGISFERPLISLTDPAEARVVQSDGLIGLRLVQQLNLSTDLRGRRLWARRNARPEPPERYGMSGLWLGERDGGVAIEEVGTGSPAAAAGLRRGDRLDGGTLAEWIGRLNGRPGDGADISYRRGAESGSVRLTLREYL
jgi:aspartyl protease